MSMGVRVVAAEADRTEAQEGLVAQVAHQVVVAAEEVVEQALVAQVAQAVAVKSVYGSFPSV